MINWRSVRIRALGALLALGISIIPTAIILFLLSFLAPLTAMRCVGIWAVSWGLCVVVGHWLDKHML
jgi:hypothetical protein